MSDTKPLPRDSLAVAEEVDALCDRFEAALRRGEAGALDGWLPAGGPARTPALVELARMELEYRLRAGEAVRAEDYIARYPELASDAGSAARLLAAARQGRRTEPTTVAGDQTGPATPSPSAAPSSAAGPIPGYEILGELGRGGMGVVYKARHLKLNRIVALKMILAGGHADEEDRARFRAEAEAVARLQHPNIVQVHEIGEHEGKPFFSLEFCPGGSLDRKLAGTPLPPKEATQLVETLARAVHAAHQQNVVHRDLKPANVLLAADGTPKITDFGLAKKLDEAGATHTGAVMGTPSYMAPEQAGGKSKQVGPPADVYALGAILYECLTGRPPFKAATMMETLQQVLRDEPAAPRRLQSKTPRDLETICLKCLEKQPGRRYTRAAELADDLGRWQRGEPVRARPPSLGYVLGKWARRHRAPLTAAAGMLVLLVAVVTTAFVLLLGAWGAAQNNFETADQRGKDLEKERGELKDALNAKQQTLDSLNKQLSIVARGYAERSEVEYRAGNFRDCLSWMLRAYEVAPREDPLRRSYARLTVSRGLSPLELTLWHEDEVMAASFSLDGRTVVTGGGKTAHLWDAGTGKELQRLPAGDVWEASFSPDGRTVVTGSWDKTARLWDVASGKQLHLLRHDMPVSAASFGPDGRTVVTASQDKTVRLWDAASGKQLQRLPCEGGVQSASFSPDGRTVVSDNDNGPARLWDVGSGMELHRFSHDGAVFGASFSPDGRTIVTAGADKIARLWDLSTGKELQRLVHEAPVQRASFSPDGRTVLTVCGDKTTGLYDARLWDAGSGKQLHRLPHDGAVYAASFSPDGRTVLTGSKDRTARLWDAASGIELQRLPHEGEVMAALFSPDGRTVLTGSKDRTARLWDVTGGQQLQRLSHQDIGVYGASFSLDGRTVLTASMDHTARLWDAASGKELQRLAHEDQVHRASFSPDGRTVVTASLDKTARVWDAATGKELQRLTHDDLVSAASFSPDSRTVLTASYDTTARLWDAATGQELHRLTHDGHVEAASFSPDGRTVLTGSKDKAARLWDARLWDAATGKELQRLPHMGYAASFSPDGRTVLASSQDQAARLWDAASGKQLQRLTHEGGVLSASFSPDGRTVVTAGGGDAARLWDAASGKELHQLPHEGGVLSASFSPDGRTVVTAGVVGTARLWDAQSGMELQRFSQRFSHGFQVNAASFSPDGRMVLTANYDGSARLWDADFLAIPDDVDLDRLRAWVLLRTGQAFTDEGRLRPLSQEEWQQQSQTLDARGGDWLPSPDPRRWHRIQAAEAEARHAWFAARFHLNLLLADDPNNADLLLRRDDACAHLKDP